MDYAELMIKINKKLKEEEKQEKIKKEEEIKKKAQELGLEYKPKTECDFHGDCDNPNTMENSTATILYVITMIGGAIFNDRWLIWIMATVIFIRFLTRHKRNKK